MSTHEAAAKGNSEAVLLDLNFPGFQTELFDAEPSEIKKIFKTLKKLKAMRWEQVFQDHGLKWEEIKSMAGKYSLRLSQLSRAVVIRQGAWMRFQALHQDHDATYGKK